VNQEPPLIIHAEGSLPPTEIHFVRHGEVENPDAILYGRLPGFALSGEGRRQVQAAAQFFRDKTITAIFSGPLLRATQTAEMIAAVHPGLTVTITELLNEVCVPLQGRPLYEGVQLDWDLYSGNEPPHERGEGILARAQEFIAQVRQRYAGQEVVAVTHGDVIAFAMVWATHLPFTVENKSRLYKQGYVMHASITTFRYETASAEERPTVAYVVPYQT
jgi:broad specificity phosphatase PhoE